MNIDATDIALAESVTPRGVHAYLAANGWTKVLLAPVTPSLTKPEETQLPLLEPFERREARMLVSGLRASREATELVNRGEDIGAFEDRIGKGVSANLCQAAAKLINTGSGLDVSVSWALTRQPHEDQPNERATVEFTPSDAPVLAEAARILSDRQERSDERIEGYVSALARDQSDPDGRVTIEAVVDGALASVKADFSQPEYNRIADAHARRLSVSLEGDLQREGQRWRLMNPRDLTLIEDED